MTAQSGSRAAETAGPAPVPTPAERLNWGTTIVVLAGTFMSVLDFFIVNVAIPSIQRDLNTTDAQIQFIVAGYALAYAVGLITGGRLGDLYGRRKMFIVGVAAFTAASVACGLAPTASFLVFARIVQGLAAALMAPQVLSLLSAIYAGEARARAFNAYGVIMGLAAVSGQLIGGVLIQTDLLGLSWRGCFLINLPIGIATIALVPRLVPASRAPGKPRIDIIGMVIVTVAMTAIILPLIEGRQLGWPTWAWISLVAAIPAFWMFVRFESGLAAREAWPLVDPSLFRERAFTYGLTAQVGTYTAVGSYFLALAIYLQVGRGLNPLQAGLLFVATGTGYLATSTNARRVVARLGRQTIALGALLRVAGMGLLMLTVWLTGTTGSPAWLIPALMLEGAGTGLMVGPLATTILSRIPPQLAGAASGVLNAGFWVGNAIGVAVSGVLFYGVLTHAASSGNTGNPYPDAFMLALVYFIVMNLFVIAIIQRVPRGPNGR